MKTSFKSINMTVKGRLLIALMMLLGSIECLKLNVKHMAQVENKEPLTPTSAGINASVAFA